MNEEKRCSNCAFPNMSKGYFSCEPMDHVPLTPFSTCIKWEAKIPIPTSVDEEEIPAELLGVTEDTNVVQYVPGIGIVEESEVDETTMKDLIPTSDQGRSVLDIILTGVAEEEAPTVDAECAPKGKYDPEVGGHLPDEHTGALDAIAQVIPRLPDMRADIPEYTPEESVAMTKEVEAINKNDGDERIYANTVGTLDSKKYQDLLTLTYKGCAIAVPAADAVLDINKKFKQFVDKNVVAW